MSKLLVTTGGLFLLFVLCCLAEDSSEDTAEAADGEVSKMCTPILSSAAWLRTVTRTLQRLQIERLVRSTYSSAA
jgi:hypothetical protein